MTRLQEFFTECSLKPQDYTENYSQMPMTYLARTENGFGKPGSGGDKNPFGSGDGMMDLGDADGMMPGMSGVGAAAAEDAYGLLSGAAAHAAGLGELGIDHTSLNAKFREASDRHRIAEIIGLRSFTRDMCGDSDSKFANLNLKILSGSDMAQMGSALLWAGVHHGVGGRPFGSAGGVRAAGASMGNGFSNDLASLTREQFQERWLHRQQTAGVRVGGAAGAGGGGGSQVAEANAAYSRLIAAAEAENMMGNWWRTSDCLSYGNNTLLKDSLHIAKELAGMVVSFALQRLQHIS